MKIHRLTIADHPLLVGAAAVLDSLEAPHGPFLERGDFWTDIEGDPPKDNRPRPHNYHRKPFHPPRPLDLPPDVHLASINYYPPGGAGMGWHTDSTSPGWRVYLARPLGVPGCFITMDDGRRVETYDEDGIALAFFVSGEPDTWHAVRTMDARFSLGLRLVAPGPTAAALGLE